MRCAILSLLLVALPSFQFASAAGRGEGSIGDIRTQEDLGENVTVRRVDQNAGMNSPACLNPGRLQEPPESCRSLQYALHESEDISVGGRAANLKLKLRPGVYQAANQTTRIYNSYNVAIVGAGLSQTFFVCGANGTADAACTYLNFQIANSSWVFISNVTFTGCGPITSSLYAGKSDFVFIDNCSFEDNKSPGMLVYNTPNIRVRDTLFRNNTPEELDPKVVHDRCYFTRQDNQSFFVDNRTTSGGISLFVEGQTADVAIENCTFVNNAARNDTDVTLIRKSRRNGYGGALNLRLLDSSDSVLRISDCLFADNTAEAHAGAMAISMAGATRRSKVLVTRTRFEGNWCLIEKCTGGAVGVSFFPDAQFNQLRFVDTNFTGNGAQSSGALVLSTSVGALQDEDEESRDIADLLLLEDCWFFRNQAFFEGTALGVFSITHTNMIGIPVNVTNCHFHDNRGSRGSGDTTAVTVYRVLLAFYGNNTFYNNSGGGASLLSSRMDVIGGVTFESNTAVFGAGLALSGRSLILLSRGSELHFLRNIAKELGAGIYVEFLSTDFVLSILNTGCFIRYNSTSVDVAPSEWVANVTFVGNQATVAGAAIYASDMSRCRWLGEIQGNHTIFELSPQYSSFQFVDNRVVGNDSALRGNIANETLATNPSTIIAQSEFMVVSYGEQVRFSLSSQDQLDNFREAVWSVDSPGKPTQQERLGALSSNTSAFTYNVPSKSQLLADTSVTLDNDIASFNVTFSLLNSEGSSRSMELRVEGEGCHPGYHLDKQTQKCVCTSDRNVVRCDRNQRYFYTRDSLWVNVSNDSTPFFANAVPGFLSCSRLGNLTGCLYRFDDPNKQCATGRQGTLCGDCREGYGVSFDLRFCRQDCSYYGILLFVGICLITPIASLAALYFDFPVPNELKGAIFYAQVVGVIYRSTPLLSDNLNTAGDRFFDFMVNFLGFAMPFPVCLHESVPVVAVALLGYVPPLLAFITAFAYAMCANRVQKLSNREKYGFHGFYTLLLFVYKYVVDTSFIFISCTNVNGESIFLYQGTQRCGDFPFILLVLFGSLMLVLFGIVLPIYILKILYAPQKMIQVRNALSHGLKDGRRYLWYGVWDIWRRLLFVGASLFISITTRSVVLFIHCLLILLCLSVLCIVKPYRKYHINITEGLVLCFLLSTTLAIYDRGNDLYVGGLVASVTVAVPFLFAIFFIIYRITKVICRKIWPKMSVRCKESCMGSVMEWCDKMKQKMLNLRENQFKETTQENTDKWRMEVIQPTRMKNYDSSSLEETFAPQLRESLLDDGHT